LEAFVDSDGKRLIGYGAFGRPQARRSCAEDAFVIFAGAAQLFASIIRLAIGAARQRSSGIGDARDVGVAQERKNWVIERRGADFDLTALRRFAINRQHEIQQFRLPGLQRGFVWLAEIFSLVGQPTSHVILCKPLFVHPSELR
jgi:hypothetical protein